MKSSILCFMLLVVQPISAEPLLRFSEGVAAPGDTLSVSLYLEHEEPISGVRIAMSFDDAALILHRVVQVVERLALYSTQTSTGVDLVFIDPAAGNVLDPGVQELARLVVVVKPNAAQGAYHLAVSDFELTGGALPPNRIIGTAQNGNIWVTENRLSVGTKWLSYNEIQVDVHVMANRPIAGLQLSLNWLDVGIKFDHLQTDLDWQLFDHMPKSQVLSLVGANLSGQPLSVIEETAVLSIFFDCQDSTMFTQDIEVKVGEVLITDDVGDEVRSVFVGGILDIASRPSLIIEKNTIDTTNDTVTVLEEKVQLDSTAVSALDAGRDEENASEGVGQALAEVQEDDTSNQNVIVGDHTDHQSGNEGARDTVSVEDVETDQDTTGMVQGNSPIASQNDIQDIDLGVTPIVEDTTEVDAVDDESMPDVYRGVDDAQEANSVSQPQEQEVDDHDSINMAHGLRFDEILADPPPGGRGDANGDGIRDSRGDEFVELVNDGEEAFDLSGYLLSDDDVASEKMFRFPVGTILQKGERLVLFGGGKPQRIPGQVFVDDGSIGNGLTNTRDRVILLDPMARDTILSAQYHDGNGNQSLAFVAGRWMGHSAGNGKDIFSPGRKRSVIDVLLPAPALVELVVGQRMSIQALAQYTDGTLLPLDPNLLWVSQDTNIVKVDSNGGIVGQKVGRAEVWFFSRGRESLKSQVKVRATDKNTMTPERKPETLVISEVYPNPATGMMGDQNGDGQRHTYEDEFVEVYNWGDFPVHIGGFYLGDDDTPLARLFRFPPQTIIPSKSVIVLFGGGVSADTSDAQITFIDDGRIGDGLSNAGDKVMLLAANGITLIDEMTYTSSRQGVSFVTGREGNGELHTEFFDGVKSSVGEIPETTVKEKEKKEHANWRLPEGLVFSEVFLNPGSVDANGDGVVSQHDDAFVELSNAGKDPLDLSGWLLGNADIKVSQFFRFPPETVLLPGDRMTVFGGGDPTGIAGTVLTSQGQIAGGLSRDGAVIHLAFPDGHAIAKSVIVSASEAGISWLLAESGDLKLHPLLPGQARISPGRQEIFVTRIVAASLKLAVSIGDTINVDVLGRLSNNQEIPMNHVIAWWVSDWDILSVKGQTLFAKGIGSVRIKGLWNGLETAEIDVTISKLNPDDRISEAVLDSLGIVEDVEDMNGAMAVTDTAGVLFGTTTDEDSLSISEEDSLAAINLSGPALGDEPALAANDALRLSPNHPPVWVSAVDTSAVIGLAFRYKPHVVDKDGDSVDLRLRSDTDWLRWDGQALAGIPSSKDVGTLLVRFEAADERDTLSIAVSIQVLSLNETFEETQPTAQSLIWRHHIDVPPGVQVQVEGGPEWYPDDQSLVWRPDRPGEFSIVVSVSTDMGDEILMPLIIHVSPMPAFTVHDVIVDPQRDVNGDGHIDHLADQYLAIGNVGEVAVDMSGWLLGDDDGRLTQLPDGIEMAPGDTLVLIGRVQEKPEKLIFSGQGRIGNGLALSDRILLIAPAGPDTLVDFSYTRKKLSGVGAQSDTVLSPSLDKSEAISDGSAGVVLDRELYPSPNPFNSATRVRFFSAGGPVSVTVYSILGQPIRRLVQQTLPAGFHQRIWDGTNDLGMPVSSGIYLVHSQNQMTVQTHRVALLR